MFILKRQDVEITSIQHPNRDQPIPILQYQGQAFRLINVFNANQEEEAKAFWRDLTDNRGKACVLLEEPERYSVWGKVRMEQLTSELSSPGTASGSSRAVSPAFVQAALLLLQSVYIDVEDLLGTKQAIRFQKDFGDALKQAGLPAMNSSDAVNTLLQIDPLDSLQLPSWQEQHLNLVLGELHRLAKQYFGNTSFITRALEALQDLPASDRTQFMNWLGTSTSGKLWK